MFNVVTDRRKRSVWTPRTVAASVGAHLLLLGVFVTVAESTPAPRRERVVDITLPADRPKPPAPKPVAPPPPAPDQPQPTKGDFVSPRPPDEVPDVIRPDPRPTISERDVRGIGIEGDIIGTPTRTQPTAPTGNTEPQPDWSGTGPMTPEMVTVLPRLSNEREAQRMLQRVYPPLLRDAGVTGRTTVVLIIDRDGNVEPGSVRVQDTTDPRFEEAAVRAAEKMRFTPAEFQGHRVAVLIALPIEWQLRN